VPIGALVIHRLCYIAEPQKSRFARNQLLGLLKPSRGTSLATQL